jgi:dolichyl-diphosphooligosaccharide--protein glycosyltransferase
MMKKMAKFKFYPKYFIGLLIILFFLVALCYRVLLPYKQIFVGDWIKFTSNDAYFYMRIVDNLVHNFPHLTHFDPFFIYPGGFSFGSIIFFGRLLAGITWLIGLGSPSPHTIDVIAAYFPAILAALTVIPVYFIGKALFNQWTGVLAAALVAVLPGEFLGRSILGFTDHHVAETLFSTVAVLFLMLAIKTARQRGLSFNHIIKSDWRACTRPLVYALLAGMFLGVYLITWAGALVFVFIFALYFIFQFIIDHLRGQSTDYLGIVGAITFFIALIIYMPFSLDTFYTASLIIGLLIVVFSSGVSRLLSTRRIKPAYYPLSLLGLGVVGLGIFYAIYPSVVGTMLSTFSIFAPAGATATTTLEMQPFLAPQGTFSTAVAWGNFTTSFFLIPPSWGPGNIWFPPGFAFFSLLVLVWLYSKQISDEKQQLLFRVLTLVILAAALILLYFSITWALILFIVFFVTLIWLSIKQRHYDEPWLLLLVWTLVILVMTLVQRRFAYYLVVNIALLSAYLAWQAIWHAGIRKLVVKPEPVTEGIHEKSARAKKKGNRKNSLSIYHINASLAVIIVFFLVFFPNITKAKEVASQAPFAPSDGWQESLTWMKDNTPDPFGDPADYYKLYEPPSSGEDFAYPKSAYGVTAWWDYGYWITRIAHRLPSTNPSQNPKPITQVASLFLSQNVTLAKDIMKELDSSYVIADYQSITSKFWAVITWAGREQNEFVDIYYLPYQNRLVGKPFYTPEYYRSTLVRLYSFDGKAVTDEKPTILTFKEMTDSTGYRYKQVTETKEFSSYQEALDYVAKQGPSNHVIVGVNPFVSPIPLEALENFKLVFSSASLVTHKDLVLLPKLDVSVNMVPEIKIFEYTGN